MEELRFRQMWRRGGKGACGYLGENIPGRRDSQGDWAVQGTAKRPEWLGCPMEPNRALNDWLIV